jgi:hypothetical protein
VPGIGRQVAVGKSEVTQADESSQSTRGGAEWGWVGNGLMGLLLLVVLMVLVVVLVALVELLGLGGGGGGSVWGAGEGGGQERQVAIWVPLAVTAEHAMVKSEAWYFSGMYAATAYLHDSPSPNWSLN